MVENLGIQVENLGKVYRRGGTKALSSISLAVAPGEIFGLIGPNGAGKTTFFGCLLGLLRPTTGSVVIAGESIRQVAAKQAIGYLPERLLFERWMTGWHFMEYHHALARQPKATRRAEIEATLDRVGLERGRWHVTIKEYSRGMLQRLGLAQALIGKPKFLFLDEPTSGVDPSGVLLFRKLIGELKADGITAVINSHQLDQIEKVCDRVAFIERGELRAIENLHTAASAARIAVVRWSGELPPGGSLQELAVQVGVELKDVSSTHAKFAVGNDDQAAQLIRGLVEKGVRVVEVLRDDSRLERFFSDPAGGR